MDLCSQFTPAMKYFFFENFPSAGLYIERRLAYSRSTATSSMIGYILGLGKFKIVLEGFDSGKLLVVIGYILG
jgi:hypothetical protein